MQNVAIFKTCERIAAYGLMDSRKHKAIFFSIMCRFITIRDALEFAQEHGLKVSDRIHVASKTVEFNPKKALKDDNEWIRAEEEVYKAEHGCKKISDKPKFAQKWAHYVPFMEEDKT